MKDEVLEKLIKAGKIATEAFEHGRKMIKPGVPLIRVCEEIENRIRRLGGEVAFPVNISINNVAAHYTSPFGDTKVFRKGMVVKLDIGAHVDGYISDTARTIIVGEKDSNYMSLVEASENALLAAEKLLKANVKVNDISSAIKKAITSMGFTPVKDLTGHSIEQYNLHSGISIPNVPSGMFSPKLKEGMVVAIEPFATTGKKGHVMEDLHGYIYSLVKDTAPSTRYKPFIEAIKKRYRKLPFAARWITWMKRKVAEAMLNQLVGYGVLYKYNVLKDVDNGIVSQAENTYIITKDGFIRTTHEKYTAH